MSMALSTGVKNFRRRGSCSWLPLTSLLLCLLLASGSGCRNGELEGSGEQESGRLVIIDGITVPVFETATEQLTYTRSWFADLAEKRAALRALLQLFPEKRQSCGMAALDLAYIELGSDYRLSREDQAFAAIKAYQDIAANYQDIPQVSAKAYWYIGWVYADLLADKPKGMEYYRLVAEKFPREKVFLLPPAPWVSIIYSDDVGLDTELYTPPRDTWAGLALLEMIRNSDDGELAWSSFVRLWRQYRHSSATGFGLRLILERRIRVDESLILAREYLKEDFSDGPLQGDIQRLVQDISLQGGGA